MNFEGKVAVVTGGYSGIGKAIAETLAKDGADIALVGLGPKEEALESIGSMGVKVKAYDCDVSDFEKSGNVITEILADFGRIDFLVNNAGICKDNLVLKMDESDFDAVISVNLKGAFNMIKHTYKMFMKQRSGRIVNMASIVGLNGNAGQANYSASKAGLIGVTKSVAKELAARNVTVNAIAPGYIDTAMTQALSDKVKDEIAATIPMKRRGKPEDVANVVKFLCSDMAAYVTGEVIRVDGGIAM
ncbi:MAG: 3-oxoacyl-[acyl-carrier-protein] reductase [Oscillospiraceae bacterium]|nr:3-oxoacyl-[acyl-carrier-protein] reductase [Oscillospiraceae bacterium]